MTANLMHVQHTRAHCLTFVSLTAAGDGGDDAGARRRRRVGHVLHGLLQHGRLPLAVRLRPVRKPTGTSPVSIYLFLPNQRDIQGTVSGLNPEQ